MLCKRECMSSERGRENLGKRRSWLIWRRRRNWIWQNMYPHSFFWETYRTIRTIRKRFASKAFEVDYFVRNLYSTVETGFSPSIYFSDCRLRSKPDRILFPRLSVGRAWDFFSKRETIISNEFCTGFPSTYMLGGGGAFDISPLLRLSPYLILLWRIADLTCLLLIRYSNWIFPSLQKVTPNDVTQLWFKYTRLFSFPHIF